MNCGQVIYRQDSYTGRLLLYNQLTPEGQAFVDGIALELERGFKARRGSKVQFGVGQGRELAMALLEHFWSGEDFPGTLDEAERVELQGILAEMEMV